MQGDAELLFDAELRPNRSLSPRGFRILMAALILICLGVGIAFYLKGAWPVLGFLGLDVAAVYFAFRLSYRSGRLTERVRVRRAELSIDRIQPNGRQRHWSFQPYWARVRLEQDNPDIDDGTGSVLVTSHGRSVRLGRFLAPEERQSFADALSQALRRAVHS